MSLEIIRMLDAELGRLQAARAILAEMAPSPTKSKREHSPVLRPQKQASASAVELGTASASPALAPAQVVSDATPVATPPVRRRRPRSPRVAKKQTPPSPPSQLRALGGIFPSGPVVVSASAVRRPVVAEKPKEEIPRESALDALVREAAVRSGRATVFA